jgi:hypothetical protein
MRCGIYGLAIALLSSGCSAAATTTDPLSGLPIAVGVEKTADPVQSLYVLRQDGAFGDLCGRRFLRS